MPAQEAEGSRFYQRPAGPDLVGLAIQDEPGSSRSFLRGRLFGGGSAVRNYDRKWGKQENQGEGGLYTESSGMVETPLLGEMVRRLSGRRGPITVMEAGSGSGDQAFHIASAFPESNTSVIAVDTSKNAIKRLRRRAIDNGQLTESDNVISLDSRRRRKRKNAKAELQKRVSDRSIFPENSSLIPVRGDLLESIRTLPDASLDAFHANSVFHFLTEAQRQEAFTLLQSKLKAGGLIAISFKAYDQQDALIAGSKTKIISDHKDGYLVDVGDGVTRFFMKKENDIDHSDTRKGVIETEFEAAGLRRIDGVQEWKAPGYDREGEDSHFVGILAEYQGNAA